MTLDLSWIQMALLGRLGLYSLALTVTFVVIARCTRGRAWW